MSTAQELHSTPASHRVASKNLAGDLGFKQDEIKEEVELDLRNAVKCPFDKVLKYFLYLVLEKESKEKKRLDELQTRIEALQAARYYKKDRGGNGAGETMDNGAGNSTTGPAIAEKARQEETVDDSENGTSEEKTLVREREGILDKLLRDALEAVLPIATDKQIIILLNVLGEGFDGDETNRYGPYVNLCNVILSRLESFNGSLPFRGRDRLNIRFQCHHPSRIYSSFQGTTIKVDRSPDVIISSLAALFHLNGQVIPDFTRPPLIRLRWPIVISCVEFKVHKVKYPEGVKTISVTHKFELRDKPVLETSHAQLPDFDNDEPGEEEGTEDIVPSATGSKRSRDAANLGDNEDQGSSKKAKSAVSTPVQEVTVDKQTQKAIHGRVQCASYALEMLSYSAGVHHAINILFTDGIMWIWYYDRQGIIQSTGIGVFEDFPRFIVLLLALQRFSPENWGIIPALNPEAMHEHEKPTPSEEELQQQEQQQQSKKGKGEKRATGGVAEEARVPPVVVDLKKDLEHVKDFTESWRKEGDVGVIELSKVELNMKEFLSNQPHCLAGRATAVVPAVGRGENSTGKMEMVCKVYHPEVQRRHEGLTMEVIYNIVADDKLKVQQDPEGANAAKLDMFKHLPKFYFHGDVKDTTTHRVRSMVNRSWKGHRTMRIIGMKQLRKITKLSGWEFVKGWLEGAICHAFLWKNFVEHGDPSVSNLMYDPDTKSGVLTDFDLSLLQWEPRVFGTDRTGTVPFMALDLLTKEYWSGAIKRYYHHELESFIWILPYVFLLYKDGARQRNTLVDPWRTSNYDTCLEKKAAFYSTRLNVAQQMVQPDFKDCWSLALRLCLALRNFHGNQQARKLIGTEENPFVEHPPTSSASHEVQDSEDLWKLFAATVKLLKSLPDSRLRTLVDCFEYYKPSFTALTPIMEAELQGKYHPILHPQQM